MGLPMVLVASDSAGIQMEANSSTFSGNYGPIARADTVSIHDSPGSTATAMLVGTWSTSPLHLMVAQNPRLTVSGSGDVGIGTMTPAALLDIYSTGGVNSAIIIPRDTTANRPSGVNGMIRYNTNSAKFEAFQNNQWLDIVSTGGGVGDNLGNHTANQAILAISGTAATPGYSFGSNGNRGMYAIGTGGVGISAGSLERMRINADGNIGIGTSSPTRPLDVQGISTATAVGTYATINGYMSANPSAAATNATFAGVVGYADSPSSNANNMGKIVGVIGGAEHDGTGTASDVRGGQFGTYVSGANPVTDNIGVRASAYHENSTVTNIVGGSFYGSKGTGTATNISGVEALADTSGGTASYLYGVKANAIGYLGSTIHSAYGVHTKVSTNSTLTNGYGLFVDENVGATNSFGVYQVGTNDRNFFGGNVGIGTSTPGTHLDVFGTGAILIPRNTAATRPFGINGMIRYNTTSNKFEVYQGLWQNMISAGGGGATDIDGLSDAISNSFNLFMGAGAGDTNSGDNNTAIGVNALTSPGAGNENTAIGTAALFNMTSGSFNTALGYGALGTMTTTSGNTALGHRALEAVAGGSNNIGVGKNAGDNISSGSNNIIIGYDIDAPSATGSNQLSIGNIIYGIAVNGTGSTISTGNIGIGSASPISHLDVAGTGAIIVPRATTAQRPFGVNGMIRFNSTSNKFEVYQGLWMDMIQASAGGSDNLGNHTATTSILAVLGTASTPGYSFGTNGNRGMYAVGTGALAFSTASVERLRIDSTGYIGIGTTSPDRPLLIQTASDTMGMGHTDGTVKMGSWIGTDSRLTAQFGTNTYHPFDLITNDSARLSIDRDGLVGIGSMTPAAQLDIGGTGALLIPRNTAATRPFGINGMIRYNSTSNKFEVYQGLWMDMIQGSGGASDNLGNHTATTSILAVLGTASTPGYSFGTNGNRGMYAAGTGGLGFSTGSLERIRVAPDGRVGIGTNNPTEELEVAGTISGDYLTALADLQVGAGNNMHWSGRSHMLSPADGNILMQNFAANNFGMLQLGGTTASFPALKRNSTGIDFRLANDSGFAPIAAGDGIFNGNVGIGSSSPSSHLDVAGTGAIIVPRNTTATRPFGLNGMIRYNTTSNKFEAYQGTWQNMISSGGAGGATDIDGLSDAISNATASSVYLGTSAGTGQGNSNTSNVALGFGALDAQNNATSTDNVAIGKDALGGNQSGHSNTAIGSEASLSITGVIGQTAIGAGALRTNSVAIGNTAVGTWGLYNATGASNTVVGSSGGMYISSGAGNTGVGSAAITGVSGTPLTGNDNTAVGASALTNIRGAAANNTALGTNAGDNITTGSNNIIIGASIDAPSATSAGIMTIGNLLYGSGLGATGTTVSTGNIGIGSATPISHLDVAGTGAIIVPRATTAQRPFGVNGMIRFNTTAQKFEVYQGLWMDMLSASAGGSDNLGNHTATTSILALLGTAATPGYSFGTNGNRGMYAAGTGNLAFSTASQNRMTILSNGNIGFGTAVPGHKLNFVNIHSDNAGWDAGSMFSTSYNPASAPGANTYYIGHVSDVTTAGASSLATVNLQAASSSVTHNRTGTLESALGNLSSVDNASTGTITDAWGLTGRVVNNSTGTISNASGITVDILNTGGTVTNAYGVYVGGIQGTSRWSFYASDSSARNYFAGNVGIGSTIPASHLDVTGTGAIIVPRATTAQRPFGLNGMIRFNTTSNKFEVYQGLWQDMIQASAGGSDNLGNHTATTSILAVLGTAATPGYSFSANGNRGMYAAGTGAVAFSTASLERMRIDATGNVGIGTSNPVNKLVVKTGGTGPDISFGIQVGDATWSAMYMQTSPTNQNAVLLSSGLDVNLNRPTGGQLRFSENDSTMQMVINPGGNVGIGSSSPSSHLDVGGTGAIIVPRATQAQRPFGINGMIRYNTNLNKFEGFQSGSWLNLVSTGGAGSSQWTTSGSDIYYNTARVGIGTTAPYAWLGPKALHVADEIYADDDIRSATSVGAPQHGSDDGMNAILTPASPGYVAIKTQTTERMRVDAFGKVGIGTSDPSALGANLAVYSPIGAPGSLVLATDNSGNNDVGLLRFYDNDNGADTATISAYDGAGNSVELRFATSTTGAAPTTKMTIDDQGRVGVGTATPATHLDVAGTGAIMVPRATTAQRPFGLNGMIRFNTTSNKFEVYQGLWQDMLSAGGGGGADDLGDHTATTSILAVLGTAATPGYSFVTNGNRGMYAAGTGSLGFSAGSIERMRIQANGRIGIGTNNPLDLLHIKGQSGVDTTVQMQRAALADSIDLSFSQHTTPSVADPNWYYGMDNSSSRFRIETWDNSVATDRLSIMPTGFVGINTNAPASNLDVTGTGSIIVPRNTTATRPFGINGMIRFNTTAQKFEVYQGLWQNMISAGGGGGSQWTTNGTSIYYNTGAVGINTTTPKGDFHIRGTGALAAQLTMEPNAYGSAIGFNSFYNGSNDKYVATDSAFLFYHDVGVDKFKLMYAPSGTSGNNITYQEGLALTSSGAIGIGTATPASNNHKLHIYNDADAWTETFTQNPNGGTGAASVFTASAMGDNWTVFGVGGYNNSNAAIAGRGFIQFHHNSSPSAGLSLISDGSGDIRMYTTNTPSERMRITNGGFVGIGSTTPGSHLDVAGTGAIIVPRGLTATRPFGINGMIRYNTNLNVLEAYANSNWGTIQASPVQCATANDQATGNTDNTYCINMVTGRTVYSTNGGAWSQSASANQATWLAFAVGGPYQAMAYYEGGTGINILVINLKTGKSVKQTAGSWSNYANTSASWPP
jgi:hypothetical protein